MVRSRVPLRFCLLWQTNPDKKYPDKVGVDELLNKSESVSWIVIEHVLLRSMGAIHTLEGFGWDLQPPLLGCTHRRLSVNDRIWWTSWVSFRSIFPFRITEMFSCDSAEEMRGRHCHRSSNSFCSAESHDRFRREKKCWSQLARSVPSGRSFEIPKLLNGYPLRVIESGIIREI